ncbi:MULTISPECIES: nuclear transport factor 2 family protein [Actinokineospora]|uniref:Ketosteroid isomerase n=1 Tax=Actinokineospora fastidiosa TaxID=1816 RepID=A0A918G8I5_9PSEU|nr:MULTISPECIES: nuclear transport factor 2 family protein [Actinokineospora]UVS81909.1 Ketosteroid isomerase-related protein [Actinokineospora sp. UTMC 2448]GGS24897.1 ketosteroid isomerase [Actinokineospora fastidiosa]
MTITPTDVLEGMYAAEADYLAAGGPGSASFAPLAPFFAPDVTLHQADGLPYGGIWRGHDGLARFFTTMSAVWERFDLADRTYLSRTSPLVVRFRIHARARATGRDLDFPILQTVDVEDGLITELRPFYWDTAEIAAACT